MSEQGPRKPRWRRRGVRILSSTLGLLVILASAVIALLPYAIEQTATRWLIHRGVDQAQVENVDFNPFTGTLYVRGLRAVAGDTTVLAAPEFGFTFAWHPLLNGELQVERIHLRGLELLVDNAEDGMRVAGILLGGPAPDAAPIGWDLEVDDWEVTDSVVTYRAHGVDTILRAERWRIDDFSSRPGDKPARVRFEGSVNHSPLAFEAEVTPFAETPGWHGRLTLEALDLGPLGPAFDAPTAALAGRVSAAGETAVEQARDGTLEVTYTGTLDLDGIEARTGGEARLALDGFRWDGRLGLERGETLRLHGDGGVRLGRLALDLPGADTTTRIEALSGPVGFALRRPAAGGPGFGLDASGELRGEAAEIARPKAGIAVTTEAPTWSGKLALADPEAAGTPLTLDMTGEGGAERVAVDATAEDIRVVHDAMAWSGTLGLTDAADGIRLAIDGGLRGETVGVDLPGTGVHLRHQGLTWDGTLGLGVPAGEDPVELTAEGELKGRNVAVELPGQGLNLVQSGLGWSGRLALPGTTEGDILSARGRLTGTRLEAALDDPAFASTWESPEWEGLFRLAGSPDGPAPLLRGGLTTGPWRLDLADADVRVAGRELRWREPQSATSREPPALLRGDLGADTLTVTRTGSPARLFACERVDIKDLTAGPGLEAAALGLGRLTVLPPADDADAPGLVNAASARVEQPRLGDDGIVSATLLQVRDVTAELTRSADGVLRLGPSGDGHGGPDAAGGGGATGLPVRVERIRLAGDNRLHFRDRAVEPAFETTLRLARVEVDDLDLSRPEAGARLALEGGIGDYTTLAVNGTVAPLAEPIRLDLEGRVKELDLPPLSPYAAKALGYHVTSGHMDTESELVIEDGRLDGKNRLSFRNLTVKPAATPETEELTAQLDMPLGQALKMLRDKEGNIRMTMPVSGDITAPEFDFGDAIRQALGSTVRFAAVNYLKYALGPYGVLIMVAEWAGKAADYAGAIHLNPLIFPAGSEVLDDTARDYIDHIAKLMKERPELRINLCGRAVPADRRALAAEAASGKGREGAAEPAAVEEQVLLDLARRRAEGVKTRLVEHHGIDDQQLFLCRPEVVDDAAAKPQVQPLI